jgi:hypothetical protein
MVFLSPMSEQRAAGFVEGLAGGLTAGATLLAV